MPVYHLALAFRDESGSYSLHGAATLLTVCAHTSAALCVHILHDEDLLQRPENCPWTRLTLILAQYRHLHLHLGMLMGFVLAETGLCPRTLDLGAEIPRVPYDPYA